MKTSIGVLAAVLWIGAGTTFALSQDEAAAIARRVSALNDPRATAAFRALATWGVFAPDATSGTAARDVEFRVLVRNDASLYQSLSTLKARGVFVSRTRTNR